MSEELLELLALILLLLGLVYIVGRIFLVLVTPKLSPIYATSAPVIGLSLLALQLWVFGFLNIPWNQITLFGPWVLLGVIKRRALQKSLYFEKTIFKKLWSNLKNLNKLSWVFVIGGCVISLGFLVSMTAQPILSSDVFGFWGFKAKQFYINQGVVLDAYLEFGQFFHVDYPPLYPLQVDVGYVFAGGVKESVLKGLNFIFLVSGISSLYVFLRSRLNTKNTNFVILPSFILLAAPQFLPFLFEENRYMGYADFSLGIIMMLAVIFLVKSLKTKPNLDWVFALLFAGLCSVIKNEGMVFLAIIGVIMLIRYILFLRNSPDRVYSVLLGVVFSLLVLAPSIVWWQHKRSLDISVDFSVRNLTDSGMNPAERLGTVLYWSKRYVRANPLFLWQLFALGISLVYAFISKNKEALLVALVIVLMLLSYLVSYIFSPYELVFHIFSSLGRLLTQVVPLIILLIAICLSSNQKLKS